jgi:hypothetical protein
LEFLYQGHIYYLFSQRRSIFVGWVRTLKKEKKTEEKRNQNFAIAAGRCSCSAGIAGAGSPSARPACMRISGG